QPHFASKTALCYSVYSHNICTSFLTADSRGRLSLQLRSNKVNFRKSSHWFDFRSSVDEILVENLFS
ncbi:MAG: hypothetical protein J6S23_08625, partial [Clostridia bacterium]|nr:hypothetical protein [Clostridia bacterium]